MTALQAILDDNQEALRQHLCFMVDAWSYSLSGSELNFHNAEQMAQFFMTDVITTLFYQFTRSREVQGRLLEQIEKDVAIMRATFGKPQEGESNATD